MGRKKKARRGRPPKVAAVKTKTKKKARRGRPPQAATVVKKKTRKKATKKKVKSPLDGFCLALGNRIICIDPINGSELFVSPMLDNVEKFDSLGAARKWLAEQSMKWEENEKTAGDDPGDTHREPFPLAGATAEPLKRFYAIEYEVKELDSGGWSFETSLVWRLLGEEDQRFPTAAQALSQYHAEIGDDISRAEAAIKTLEHEKAFRLKAIEDEFKLVFKEASAKLKTLEKEDARFEKFKAKTLKKF